ncbi:unnamed protein product, partial [Prorocentrum cordatum]
VQRRSRPLVLAATACAMVNGRRFHDEFEKCLADYDDHTAGAGDVFEALKTAAAASPEDGLFSDRFNKRLLRAANRKDLADKKLTKAKRVVKARKHNLKLKGLRAKVATSGAGKYAVKAKKTDKVKLGAVTARAANRLAAKRFQLSLAGAVGALTGKNALLYLEQAFADGTVPGVLTTAHTVMGPGALAFFAAVGGRASTSTGAAAVKQATLSDDWDFSAAQLNRLRRLLGRVNGKGWGAAKEAVARAAERLAGSSAVVVQRLACELSKLVHFSATRGKGKNYWRRALEAFRWVPTPKRKAAPKRAAPPKDQACSDEEWEDEVASQASCASAPDLAAPGQASELSEGDD